MGPALKTQLKSKIHAAEVGGDGGPTFELVDDDLLVRLHPGPW